MRKIAFILCMLTFVGHAQKKKKGVNPEVKKEVKAAVSSNDGIFADIKTNKGLSRQTVL
jgi:hypothetical protein